MQTTDVELAGDSPQASPRTPWFKRVCIVGLIMLLSGTALSYGASKFGSGSNMLSTYSFVGKWANRMISSSHFLPREDNNNGFASRFGNRSNMALYPTLFTKVQDDAKTGEKCGQYFEQGRQKYKFCENNEQCTCQVCGKHQPAGKACSTNDNCLSNDCDGLITLGCAGICK